MMLLLVVFLFNLLSNSNAVTYSVTTVAGNGNTGSSTGTGGKATSASLMVTFGVHQDTTGTVYFSEFTGSCVRKVDSTGFIFAYAGVCNSNANTGNGGQATAAQLGYIYGVFMDTVGEFKLVDNTNAVIRSVAVDGILTVYAGTGSHSYSGDGGPATSAGFDNPTGLWGNTMGTIYFTTSNQVRAIASNGIINLFAGYSANFAGDGGAATSAGLYVPIFVTCDTVGGVYIGDVGNNRVRKVLSGIITTVVGTGSSDFNGEGLSGPSTNINSPQGVSVDSKSGDLLYVDRSNGRARALSASSSTVNSIAGNGDYSTSSGDGGLALSSSFKTLNGLYVNTAGGVYLAEYNAGKVRLLYSTSPTYAPSAVPSVTPTLLPTVIPTTTAPSVKPTVKPTASPTVLPSVCPSIAPTVSPTFKALPVRSSPSYKVTNAYAFAGVTSTGAVMTWGSASSGGDSSSVSTWLSSGVIEVVASRNAFAALKSDGSVVAWGLSREIVGSEEYREYDSIVSLVSSEVAFAGVTRSGGVIAFGADCCGGNADQYGWLSAYLSSDVVSVSASAGAFAALKTDGTVWCWGNKFSGGGVSSLTRTDLANVVLVSSTRSAFAALTSDGSVVTWGASQSGGAMSSSVSEKLNKNTEYIVSNKVAFAGITTAGGVVTWGRSTAGGDSSAVSDELTSDVKFIAHTDGAFAALKTNGSVVVWGSDSVGGSYASATTSSMSYAVNVSEVVGNNRAFAAITEEDSAVYAWGDSSSGGELSTTLTGVVSVHNTLRAFAALLANGSVSVWGSTTFGGEIPSSVSTYLTSGVRSICVNDVSFSAIRSDGLAVGWGSTLSVSESLLSGNYSSVVMC